MIEWQPVVSFFAGVVVGAVAMIPWRGIIRDRARDPEIALLRSRLADARRKLDEQDARMWPYVEDAIR